MKSKVLLKQLDMKNRKLKIGWVGVGWGLFHLIYWQVGRELQYSSYKISLF